MKIKLLVSVAFTDGQSYSPGEIVTFDKEFAERLIATGQAEKVTTRKKATQ